MGKLNLFYKKQSSMICGNILKVKIDDEILFEVKEDSIGSIELPNGPHNLKIYFDGLLEGEVYGYLDTNIDINGEEFYVYKAPKVRGGKAKFEKCNVTSIEEFKKYVSQSNKNYKMLWIVFAILVVAMWIFL